MPVGSHFHCPGRSLTRSPYSGARLLGAGLKEGVAGSWLDRLGVHGLDDANFIHNLEV